LYWHDEWSEWPVGETACTGTMNGVSGLWVRLLVLALV